MAQAVVGTSSLRGVDALGVEVQVDVAPGLPSFTIVGLADAAVLEARDRVRSAVRAAGYEFPSGRIVVNLAPAPLRKHGTGFDLPIALGLLTATGQVPSTTGAGLRSVGELALDGSVRAVPGMLAHGLSATREDLGLLCTSASGAELEAVPGLAHHAVDHLAALRSGVRRALSAAPPTVRHAAVSPGPDLGEVRGHATAKRVLTIAAAGGHNVLLVGPPGSGKSMLARRLPGILPPLEAAARLETASVHSVAGIDPVPVLDGVRPFRAPHHSASVAGLVGGGNPLRPGEAALAHNGVLFLDELPEFGPAALQALRQPMEDGVIALVRADGRVHYPARFTVLAAMNPCPCGYFGDPVRKCACTPAQVSRYAARVGGPLLDRMDLFLHVPRIPPEDLLDGGDGGSSSEARSLVQAARAAAAARGSAETSVLSGVGLLLACGLDESTRSVLATSARSYCLSGRGVTRVLRVARTIADLEGRPRCSEDDVLEALAYRSLV